jgi:hypothetical protein
MDDAACHNRVRHEKNKVFRRSIRNAVRSYSSDAVSVLLSRNVKGNLCGPVIVPARRLIIRNIKQNLFFAFAIPRPWRAFGHNPVLSGDNNSLTNNKI